ncbi:hypothetical protein Cgig2_016859 [Carnegiea gigantea]|uniref:Ubiquitin-like domain-containing protein n=1 Tax=Carnegiea gigantea TaxID=171969 RepID=A0A9Q1QD48_9CARY|nr:hypothetical protein Cgig2_016859 [Carnegiea gigantea]
METGAGDVSRHDEAVDSGAMIEIKIKTMDSQTYSLRVDKQMSVPALKERVASVTGVVTEHQRLICRGKVLKDDQLLSAYRILEVIVIFEHLVPPFQLDVEDGHTLHLVVREPTSSSSQSLPADPGTNAIQGLNTNGLLALGDTGPNPDLDLGEKGIHRKQEVMLCMGFEPAISREKANVISSDLKILAGQGPVLALAAGNGDGSGAGSGGRLVVAVVRR